MRAAPNARMHMARVTTRHGAAMGTALVSFQNYADAQAFAHSAQGYGLFLPFRIHSSLLSWPFGCAHAAGCGWCRTRVLEDAAACAILLPSHSYRSLK